MSDDTTDWYGKGQPYDAVYDERGDLMPSGPTIEELVEQTEPAGGTGPTDP